jgi:hypothetical protein
MKSFARIGFIAFLLGLPLVCFGAGQVRTPDIVDGAVTTPKLADGAATGVKLGSDVATYVATTPNFTGNLRVGSGTPVQATTAGSFYVTGPVEFGGNVFWDGLTGPALIWVDSSHQAHLVVLDSSLTFNSGTSTLSVAAGGGGAISGTTNTIPKFTSSTTIGNSGMTDDGTNVFVNRLLGVGTASPASPLDVRLPLNTAGAAVSIGNITSGRFGTFGISLGTGFPFQMLSFAGSDIALGANGAESIRIAQNEHVGIGTGATVSANLHSLSTTEQLRLGYDASNYISHTVSSSGGLTVASVGTNGGFTFNPGGTGTFTLGSGVTSGVTTASGMALNANSLTSGTGLYVASSSLTSGKAVDVQVSGTAAAASQTALNVGTAGANGTSAITSYGGQIANTHTGTTSTNVGLSVSASGGTNNYGLLVPAGRVGIGTTTPTHALTLAYGNLEFTPLPISGAPTVALAGAAGNLSNGTYKYEVAFVTSTGVSTVGTASAPITVIDNTTNGQITLSNIPISTSGFSVTGRRIYRTQANGSTYTTLTTINDNTTTVFTDNIADTTISGAAVPNAYTSATGWILNNGNRVANFSSGGGNVYLGTNAGASDTSGISNTFVGYVAGQAITTGLGDSAFGQNALSNSSTGNYNTALGFDAALNSTTGSQNTLIGTFTAVSGTTGAANTVVGYDSLPSNTTSSFNTIFGAAGLINYNDLGASSYNTAFGQNSGSSMVNGLYNVFLGANSDYLAPGDSLQGGTPLTGVKSNGGANNELPAGTYKYVVTFTIGGVETGISQPVSITTDSSNQEVTITNIPIYTGPLVGTVNRKIYRSTLALPTTYRLLTNGLISDNLTTSIIDTTTDATIASHSVPNRVSSSLILGQAAHAAFSDQMVVGSQTSPITDMYVGNGIYPATASSIAGQSVTLHTSGGTGSNQTGGSMTLAPGQGTGTGAGGALVVQTAPASTTGSTWNSLVERLRIKSGGATGPAASATESLVRIGSTDIVGGNSSGTFLGLNAPSGYGGDLENWQVNGVSQSKTDASGNMTITGKATVVGTVNTGGVKVHRTAIASGAYTVLATDYYIAVTGTTGATFTLPAAATVGAGAAFIIKDAGRNSASSNITLNRSGSDTIDGATSLVMATNGESVMIVSDGVSNYEVN